MTLSSDLPYRKGVGIILVNPANLVFVGRRLDQIGRDGEHAWQMPQGGIDEGEDPRQTAFRELEEETGVKNAEFVAETDGWLAYDLPDNLVGHVWRGKYRGQKQKWFLMKHLGSDEEINIDTEIPEFREWKWESFHAMPDLVVPFKRDLYLQIIDAFEAYF